MIPLRVAIKAAIARGYPARLKWLCSNANPDSRSRVAYRELVMSLAAEPEPLLQSRPTVAQSRAALDRVKACPWLVKRSDCGCGVNWCAQYQHTTTRQECLECIEYGANG